MGKPLRGWPEEGGDFEQKFDFSSSTTTFFSMGTLVKKKQKIGFFLTWYTVHSTTIGMIGEFFQWESPPRVLIL